jgi:enoyl-CoA hydratase/carnithine racemase
MSWGTPATTTKKSPRHWACNRLRFRRRENDVNTAPVLYEEKHRIGLLTINRPDNRNSMDPEVLPAFRERIRSVGENERLRCLVITGSGATFCSGADFKSGFGEPQGRAMDEILLDAYRPFLAVGALAVPTIAAMNGHAIGGGFGLALMCDIRVADRDSKYGANFVRLGIHSGMAISYVLPRLIGPARANELLFTGRLISGAEAARFGIVNHATAAADVLPKAMALAEEIAQCAPAAVRMMKQSVYHGLDWDPVHAAERESRLQAQTFQMSDAAEGIRALLEKRAPVFQGK